MGAHSTVTAIGDAGGGGDGICEGRAAEEVASGASPCANPGKPSRFEGASAPVSTRAGGSAWGPHVSLLGYGDNIINLGS